MRPKWARKMTGKEWKGLQECQSASRPTLRQLEEDLELQEQMSPGRVVCWN